MKFFVQQVHQEQIEIDVSPDISLDKLSELLVSQYSFPDKPMVFINNGNILKKSEGLVNLSENSRIFVYIKDKPSKRTHKKSKKSKQSKTQNSESADQNTNQKGTQVKNDEEQKQPTKETNSNENNDNINNININENQTDKNKTDENKTNESKTDESKTDENANNTNQETTSAADNKPPFNYYQESFSNHPGLRDESLFYNEPKILSDMTKDQLDQCMSECFKKIHLKELYDEKCDFCCNLSETKRVSNIVNHNPALSLVINQFIKDSFPVAFRRNTINIDFALELAEFLPTPPMIDLVDEYEAKFEEFPEFRKNVVKELKKKYRKSKKEVVKAFIDSGYDIDQTEELLKS